MDENNEIYMYITYKNIQMNIQFIIPLVNNIFYIYYLLKSLLIYFFSNNT